MLSSPSEIVRDFQGPTEDSQNLSETLRDLHSQAGASPTSLLFNYDRLLALIMETHHCNWVPITLAQLYN